MIQPIIENSFKHGFNIRAPWKIDIKGKTNGDQWSITVTDNGVGFDKAALEQLQDKMMMGSSVSNSSTSERIGLLNICHRLQIQYKEYAIFTVKNKPKGGCSVTIGGLLSSNPKKEGAYEQHEL